MTTKEQNFPWLELIDYPAFCVKDGFIIAANYPAEKRNLCAGTNIQEIIGEHRQAYESFENGSLYLTIPVCGLPCPASVTRTQDYDIFHLNREANDGVLQALALAATELRIPLANILTITDHLLPKLESEEYRQQANQINHNLYRLLRVIGNMSDAGSDLQSSMENVDLRKVIDEIMEKAQTIFADTQVQLVYTGIQEPAFTFANTEKLERAIYNLLSNAAKFSPVGSTITANLTKNEKQLLFTVCNTTVDELRGNVWQRYRRETSLEEPCYGLGLGMTLISNAASIHGGTVLVDHPQPGTTRVTMTIPITTSTTNNLRSPVLHISDYAGCRDKGLLEFTELLPSDAYQPNK